MVVMCVTYIDKPGRSIHAGTRGRYHAVSKDSNYFAYRLVVNSCGELKVGLSTDYSLVLFIVSVFLSAECFLRR